MRWNGHSVLSAVGLVLLGSQAALASHSTASQKLPMGGIPPICYVQQARQIPERIQQDYALLDQLRRYQAAEATDLLLQWANALDSREFLDLKLEALFWVAERAIQANDLVQARAILPQIMAGLSDLPQSSPNPSYSLVQVGWRFIEVGQSEQAAIAFARSLQTFEQRPDRDPWQTANFLLGVSGGYIGLGQTQQAATLLKQSEAIAQTFPDRYDSSRPKYDLLSMLSFQYAAIGQGEKAQALFAQALDLAIAAPNTNPLVNLFETTSGYAQMGLLIPLPVAQSTQLRQLQQQRRALIIERQLQLLQSNRKFQDRRPVLYEELAKMWAETGQIAVAVQFANTVKNPQEQFALLRPLMEFLLEKGETQQAVSLLPLLHKTAQSMRDPNDRNEALQSVVTAYVVLGQADRAFPIVEGISDPVSKWLTIRTLAQARIKQGQIDEAVRLLHTHPLPKNVPDIVADFPWVEIIKGYARAGQFDRALELTRQVGNQETAWIEIALELVKAGETQRAIAVLQQIPDVNLRGIAFQTSTRQAIQQGHWDQAQILIQQVPKGPGQTFYWQQIVFGYAESRQYDQALEVARSRPELTLVPLVTCAQSAPK